MVSIDHETKAVLLGYLGVALGVVAFIAPSAVSVKQMLVVVLVLLAVIINEIHYLYT